MKKANKALEICLDLQKKYEHDFKGWVRDNINFEGLELDFLTDQQIDIADTLLEKHYLAVAGGGGIGKTALGALLVLWFLSTHPFAKVPTTAPSGHLLNDILWSEIPLWLARCKIKDLFYPTTTRLQIKGTKSWYAVARTVPRQAGGILNDTLAGFHAPYLLIICDEASGIPDPVYTALDGALTNSNAYILLISNPVSMAGYFYDVVSGNSSEGYAVRTYSSLESKLVSDGYGERIAGRYGKDSPMYKAKVTGSLIKMNEGVIVAPDVYDRVVAENQMTHEGTIVLGVDVGGADNRSVICHRIGNSIVHWDIYGTSDTEELADKIVAAWEFRYQRKHITVVVDAIGKGAGVYDKLNHLRHFDVIGHIGSEHAYADMIYQNKRSEVYDRLGKDFDQLHFPEKPPERLKKELCNIRFDFTKEKIALEDKRVLVRRLGFSTDEADALSLTEVVKSFVSRQKPSYITKKVVSRIRRVESKYGKFGRFL
ncbi:MAG: hypothetical protein KAU20_05505 [Nanoarchaeota archaeon]|nr:hypothetical protein [Nanoarchaeota archaeon]